MAVGKDEILRDTTILGKFGDVVDDRLRDREFVPCLSFDDKAGDKTEEVVGSLPVACGAKACGQEAAGLHGITLFFMIFVDFAVGTKGGMAMVFIVETVAEHELTGAPACRNSCAAREVVEPHDDEMLGC